MESKLGAMASKRSSIAHQPRALQAGFLHLPRQKPKTLPQPQPDGLTSKDGDRVSDFVAKDLRVKRVFSPNLENRSSVPSGEPIGDKEGPITPNEDSGVGKISVTAEVRNENFRNSNGHVECDEDRRFNGKGEELVHSTPPDVEILTGGFVATSSNGCPRSSNGSVLGDTCLKADSVARTGSVLKPCSKRKLFKAPGSIAYKRLLPFLLDSDNYTLQDDPNSKRVNNLEKKANIEYNLYNHAKGSSFVDSDTFVKNAIFASGLPCKTMKLNLSPPDDGDTKNFQNGGILNYSQNIVKEDSGLKKVNVVCASSTDERLTEHEVVDYSSQEQSKTSEMESLDGGTSFISEVGNFESRVSGKLCNDVSEDIRREDHFNEELKMSSLNSNIVCNPLKEERRYEKVCCTRGADQKLGSSTVGENHCNIATESDKKYGAYVRNKMVRNPLVQLKSKYSQVSVSYRRMLPFLEDIFKDNPENCASGNIDYSGPEKELPTMNLQLPSSNSLKSQDKSDGLVVNCNMPFDGNSNTLSMLALNSMNETVETDKVLLPAGVDGKLLSVSPPKLQLHSEQEMLDKCKLKMGPQLPGATLLNDQAVSPSSPATSYEPLTGEGSGLISEQSPITSEDCTSLNATNYEPLTGEGSGLISEQSPITSEDCTSLNATNYEPLTGEGSGLISEQSPITSEDCTSLKDNVSDGVNISERNSLEPYSSCVEEGCIVPESHLNLRKGILKRNPRGCRGICNCLNCSSFRLHAERAFEFSRNQLQDAEEVASDLMKELSFLRGVLEKYSDSAKGDAGYLHSNKVKEACKKASEAELIAKDRLLQMNYELGIHCRITCFQRPNVRFSNEVEKMEIEDGK